MKNIVNTLLVCLFSVSAFGQNRLVLVEHFTQASCGPCASQNPALKTLLDANSTKVVALKYQTSWPGVDPMNAANPTEAAARVQYYNVTGVPNSVMDGSGPGSSGTIVTTATINNRYNTTAPLNITASHQWTAGYDSIQIGVFVANAGTATVASGAAGSLRLHVALIEEEVNYPSAPGSNGEKDFYQVMRKMVPNASGTTMADSWTAGQTEMFTFKIKAPAYLANPNQVAVVAFIQDNSNKSVLNAASTTPLLISGLPDIGIVNFTAGLCNNSSAPAVTIKNEGSIPITSATVSFNVNGGTPVSQNWTGNLAAGATAVVNFPQLILPSGENTVVSYVDSPNGTLDVNGLNNMSALVIGAALSNIPTPFFENMESTNFRSIPSGHVLIYNTASKPLVTAVSKANVNGVTWELGGYGQSAKSLLVDFYNMPAGAQANIITPKVGALTASHKLYFNHAYASYTGEADGLKVFVSSNCGSTWTNVFDKSGTNLATAPNTTSLFAPQPTQWYPNTISLAQFAGQEIIVKFECNSAYGNNLWLDNFWISTSALGEEEIQAVQAKLYPNPARDAVKVSLQVSEAGDALVEVINLNGQTVIARSASLEAGMQNIDLQVGDLANGVYTVKIALNDRVETLRFTVQH